MNGLLLHQATSFCTEISASEMRDLQMLLLSFCLFSCATANMGAEYQKCLEITITFR